MKKAVKKSEKTPFDGMAPEDLVDKVALGYARCILEEVIRQVQAKNKAAKAIMDQAEYNFSKKRALDVLRKII